MHEVTVDEYLGASSDRVALALPLTDYRPPTSHAYSGQLVDELYGRIKVHFICRCRCGIAGALERWVSDQRLAMRRPTGPLTRLLRPATNAS